ncbi:hypothetical protein TrLO_g3821 [Triparma laevis f. longispina]|uniref:glutamate synthase (ferredoxin) n=1 Tax=Triparma laevis f. longispina TaxID=1714387 RepID=A0A9W7A304_9STRA|nr:hypothetical protein TrLO_g3821 [Triparma laevis f. longispina]
MSVGLLSPLKATNTFEAMANNIIFNGPPSQNVERDACGVGFVVNTNSGPSNRSNDVLTKGLAALDCMEHRGACGGDGESGDGAGVMTSIPWELFSSYKSSDCPNPGVGMIFLPQDQEKRDAVKKVIEDVCRQNELTVLGWREVPVDESVLGPAARAAVPSMWQLFVKAPKRLKDDSDRDGFERTLYLVRRRFDVEIRRQGLVWEGVEPVYVASFSSRTIVYKGMVQSCVLPKYYLDLQDENFKTQFCIYHRRFSTNTNPRWPLAQPMRVLGHNGEINTLLGNVNWMKARESAKGTTIASEFDLDEEGMGSDNACDIRDLVDADSTKKIVEECNTQESEDTLEPLVDLSRSDSANLDGVFELMCKSRARAPCALMALVPAAYKDEPSYEANPEIVDFYKYHGGLLEAWDGPALLMFCDGKNIGASLDRNGLRPARYTRTDDGMVYIMSETGVIPGLDEASIVEKGRLGPGQMINVDLNTGEWKDNLKIKSEIASAHPYGEWLKENTKTLDETEFTTDREYNDLEATFLQSSFGWSLEDIGMQINDMASTGKETTYSMGDDAPMAVLSEKSHPLYNYFKQRFAQVTNPPIDPLREGVVMSLEMTLGKKESIYKVSSKGARVIQLKSPVLSSIDLKKIMAMDSEENGSFANEKLSTRYEMSSGPDGLEAAVKKLCEDAVASVMMGTEVLVLSDKPEGGPDDKVYIPPLLAVGAVHHALIEAGVRMDTGIIVETGAAWSTHQFACLIGYGAHAVHPYMALETVKQWWNLDTTQKKMDAGRLPKISVETAQENFKASIEGGLLKILSKIGISLLSSYHGAQIFEVIGLNESVIDLAFKGTTSRIAGMTLAEIATETANMIPNESTEKLINYGFYKPVARQEYHANSGDLAKLLHKAIGLDKTAVGDKREEKNAKNPGKNAADYEIFKKSLNEAPLANIRDLVDFSSDRKPIPIDDVEPIEEIMKRFCTGAMSLGALSREAHETLAIAMNRIGGKSNSGEGGEDVIRSKTVDNVDENGRSTTFPHLHGLKNGDSANSFVHQIASGRFGVTPEYLVTAKQLEIKMAQGAKPGEGGQLPGPKVSDYIAGLRASKPGVTLISPPPHHDIYSIEDLAQLIHDLHAINENAGVSVKLVSSIGIGTVACGVAKAQADVIQISGGDGGTGASPLSSIKHCGGPWELGLTEAHSALTINGLRERVTLRVDGGIRHGRDVVMAALMGGEEYGFGTIAMIAEGCIMARVCHLNTCPVGVTSQKEELRKKFPGTPEHVVDFFEFVAMEVRELLAHLGYTSLEDIIGRADLLAEDKINNKRIAKSSSVNVKPFFESVPNVENDRDWLYAEGGVKKDSVVHINGFSSDLDRKVSNDVDVKRVIEAGEGVIAKTFKIKNTDRSVGAMLSGDIARKWGNKGFKGTLDITFEGSAGQAFGAFNLASNLKVIGEANDYVGKGLHSGSVVITPPKEHKFVSAESSIVGNACLYGATGGDFHANGRAGERFCVRNSGAFAVAEGTGDHALEYMTGGVAVILGSTGRNIGAGMTGGIGYFYDPENLIDSNLNSEIVSKKSVVSGSAGELQLLKIVERHYELTGSSRAKELLDDWSNALGAFVQVYPPSESKSIVVVDGATEADPKFRLSAGSFDGDECFLTYGDGGDWNLATDVQTQHCAD